MKLTSIAKNVFAHTAPGCDMPEFVSVNQHVDGGFSIMARSPRDAGGGLGQSMLNRAKARELGLALIQATN
ncbi:hypothetical protein IVB45_17420 [Bradyrhizobium sp. 4]|uniref:hypothetical protein n=1 Tax=unclassified Bradyrhizobium TaxID=2631580 RepID=UPI001FFAFF9A|nr:MULTISPECIES: hypothetical protein [unclassified Bradyrhizobium]MCK1402045.1 hypothetical protein [Bradyrhizobium sp. 39]MCK1751235.1 hypothetical protein [Bradyrhizobium sp. 135]UPJ38490.1 hypothetical protein IVB45_17420 [Bradyrhizobium sp. 4]